MNQISFNVLISNIFEHCFYEHIFLSFLIIQNLIIFVVFMPCNVYFSVGEFLSLTMMPKKSSHNQSCQVLPLCGSGSGEYISEPLLHNIYTVHIYCTYNRINRRINKCLNTFLASQIRFSVELRLISISFMIRRLIFAFDAELPILSKGMKKYLINEYIKTIKMTNHSRQTTMSVLGDVGEEGTGGQRDILRVSLPRHIGGMRIKRRDNRGHSFMS